MTYEEALEYLDTHCTARAIPLEVKALCSFALEKQIPKKPKLQVRGVYDEDNDDWLYDQEWYMCPSCRKRNEVYRGWKHCIECGQHLDWSEVGR